MTTTRTNLALAAFLIVALAFAAWTQQRPNYGWDVMGYVGAALAWTEHDADRLHAKSYAQMRAAMSADDARALQAGDPYRADVAANAEHFRQQIPFYSVRPLYTGLLALLHAAGMNVVHAVKAVSALAHAAIGLVMLLWLRRHVGVGYATVLSLLFIATMPVFTAAKVGTVDMLSAAMVFTAFYALFERQARTAALILFGLAVAARPDNIIMVSMVLVYLRFFAPRALKVTPLHFVVLGTVMAGMYFTIQTVAGHYGWSTLFYHTFIRELVAPATTPVHISIADYLTAAGIRLGSVFNSAIPWALFAGVLAYYFSTRLRLDTAARLYAAGVTLIGINIVVRMALFPVVWDRQYIAHYAIAVAIMVAAAARYRSSLSTHATNQTDSEPMDQGADLLFLRTQPVATQNKKAS